MGRTLEKRPGARSVLHPLFVAHTLVFSHPEDGPGTIAQIGPGFHNVAGPDEPRASSESDHSAGCVRIGSRAFFATTWDRCFPSPDQLTFSSQIPVRGRNESVE